MLNFLMPAIWLESLEMDASVDDAYCDNGAIQIYLDLKLDEFTVHPSL